MKNSWGCVDQWVRTVGWEEPEEGTRGILKIRDDIVPVSTPWSWLASGLAHRRVMWASPSLRFEKKKHWMKRAVFWSHHHPRRWLDRLHVDDRDSAEYIGTCVLSSFCISLVSELHITALLSLSDFPFFTFSFYSYLCVFGLYSVGWMKKRRKKFVLSCYESNFTICIDKEMLRPRRMCPPTNGLWAWRIGDLELIHPIRPDG